MISHTRVGLATTLVVAVTGITLSGGVRETLATVPTLVSYQGFLRDGAEYSQ